MFHNNFTPFCVLAAVGQNIQDCCGAACKKNFGFIDVYFINFVHLNRPNIN